MKSFALFVALLAGSLILAAAVTYPAWLLVGAISVEPVHRVMNRVAMLIALVGLIVLTRRLGLSSRAAMGYGLPPREFVRQLAIGWICGIGLMLPLTALLLGLDVRQLKPELDANVAGLIGGAVAAGLIVAFIEETFFRGVLFTAVARSASAATAVIAPSLLYASLHFLGGKLRIPADQVSWLDGFTVLSKLFERYAQPLTFIDSFIALATLGILLALVRLRTGAIAATIGLHAAGVAVIAVLRDATTMNGSAEYGAIVGTYDGVIGWAALAWFAIIVAAYAAITRRRATPQSSLSNIQPRP